MPPIPPVEGSCTSCPQVTFRAISTHHRPNQHEYQEKLIRAFDLHFKEFHVRGEDSPPALNRFKPQHQIGLPCARRYRNCRIGITFVPAETCAQGGIPMPEPETVERAREDAGEGKSPSTQAGEFVREEMHHIREGKHGAASTKQAIAIGLSKARRAGVKLAPPKASASTSTKKQAARDSRKAESGSATHPSRT